MDQPSRSTNTNTTDTSGATRLDPAPDAEARQAQEGWSETGALNNAALSGTSSSSLDDGANAGSGSAGASGGAQTYSGAAGGSNDLPGSGSGSTSSGGKSDFDAPNASFDTDIGGKNDPGRAALGAMEARNMPSAGGAGPRQEKVTKDGQFDVLDETSA